MTPISFKKLVEMINTAKENIRQLFPEYVTEENCRDLQIEAPFDSPNVFGHCGPENGRISLGLNKYILFEELSDIVENNIYHELCHFVQFSVLLNRSLVSWDEDGDLRPEKAAEVALVMGIPKDAGHSQFWQQCAEKITKSLNLALPITAKVPYDQYKTKFLIPNFRKFLVAAYCTNCDFMTAVTKRLLEIPSGIDCMFFLLDMKEQAAQEFMDEVQAYLFIYYLLDHSVGAPECPACEQKSLEFYTSPEFETCFENAKFLYSFVNSLKK